jgi:hypothetical protein
MAQAVLDGRGRRRDWRQARLILPWVIVILLATFVLFAGIGLAQSLGFVGRWLSSVGGEAAPSGPPEEAPSAVPTPTPIAPETTPPPPRPRVAIATPRVQRREPEGEGGAGGAAAQAETTEPEVEQAPIEQPTTSFEVQEISCGNVTCAPALVCCNASCGICAAPGEPCNQRRCDHAVAPVSQACGVNTCNVGEVCCNPSCGTCVAIDQPCDPKPCTPVIQYPVSQPCGMNTCNAGEVCCNPSCGTCVEPGESCSRDPC